MITPGGTGEEDQKERQLDTVVYVHDLLFVKPAASTQSRARPPPSVSPHHIYKGGSGVTPHIKHEPTGRRSCDDGREKKLGGCTANTHPPTPPPSSSAPSGGGGGRSSSSPAGDGDGDGDEDEDGSSTGAPLPIFLRLHDGRRWRRAPSRRRWRKGRRRWRWV